jgi:hypothetical protein
MHRFWGDASLVKTQSFGGEKRRDEEGILTKDWVGLMYN